MGYPDVDDFRDYLTGLGVIDCDDEPTADVLQNMLTTAINQFKIDSGSWLPFLAEDGVRYFTLCETKAIYLDRTGLWGANDAAVLSVVIDGNALVLNTDYFLEPDQAPELAGTPYRKIVFAFDRDSCLRGCVVTGKFGRELTLPADVSTAIMDAAGMQWLSNQRGEAGVLKQEKQGSVEQQFDVDTKTAAGASQSGGMELRYKAVIARYAQFL